MIQVDHNSTNSFSFDAETTELTKALGRAQAAMTSSAAQGSRDFFIVCSGKAVYVAALASDTNVCVKLPVKVTKAKDAVYAIDYAAITGVVKGRSALTFEFSSKGCDFKALKGTYKGNFAVSSVTEDQARTLNTMGGAKVKPVKITSELLDLIKKGFQLTAVRDVHADANVFTYMALTAKGQLSVFASDRHHFAHYSAKSELTGLDLKLALPASHFALIDKVADGESAQFLISDKSMIVKGNGFLLVLPSLQSDARYFSLVPDMLKGMKEANYSCSLKAKDMKVLSQNLGSISSLNSTLAIKCGKTLAFELSSTTGKASEALKVDTSSAKSIDANVDPRLFLDLCSVMPDSEMQFDLQADKWARFTFASKTFKSTYVTSLIPAKAKSKNDSTRAKGK